MKDEAANKPISEFVFLRPKMYSYRYVVDGEEHVLGEQTWRYGDVLKGKGIGRVALEQQTRFEMYKECLLQPKQTMATCTRILSKQQTLYTATQEKVGLSGIDTKRYVKQDRLTTLPFGHKDLPAIREKEEQKQKKKANFNIVFP